MRSPTQSSNGSGATFAPRQRDRRHGLSEVVMMLSRSIADRSDTSLVRGAFEHAVRRLLPVRSIALRDGQRASGPPARAETPESIAVDVPGMGPGAILEAAFEPGAPLGDWDFQMMGTAAALGSLVLEIERSRLQLARAGLLPGLKMSRDGAAPLIGSTPAMRALRSRIERVAATDFTVLIEGESGVGKELVARQIHDLSRRRTGPFVAINCAALVDTLVEAELFGIEERTATGVRGRRGKFEHADGGTLFLDEVPDLSLAAQAKLLRIIQDLTVERVGGHAARKVDVRIVAATNRSLGALVEQRLFRPDLFYRLSGLDVRVPTLRERQPDILELARYFLERHRAARALRLSAAAADALMAHHWPGNVRELERLMERVIAFAETDIIDLDDLPPAVRGEATNALLVSLERNDTMRVWGSRYARLVMQRCGGNKRAACHLLGISYHTLNAYLRYPLTNAPSNEGRSDGSSDVSDNGEAPGVSGECGTRDGTEGSLRGRA
jgi:DNA-binding NtrC family response regulator